MTKLSVAVPTKLRHPFHPRHTMRLFPDDDGVRFRCDGCKLPGAGARYECAACDVDLHVGCALAPREREIGGFTFELSHKPPVLADGSRVVCDACGEAARGFVYHCGELDHDLHPLCAAEPRFELAGLSFELCRDRDNSRGRCACCDKKISRRRRDGRDAWYYRCGEAASLHVACAKVLASKGFDNVPLEAACDKALAVAYASKYTPATAKSKVMEDVVAVSAPALRKMLLRRSNNGRGGGALERSLRVLRFVARVVIGIIFGDPTAMIAAVAGVVLSSTG